MTMGVFGTILPVQRSMVLLAALEWDYLPQERSDDEWMTLMRSGRSGLVARIGVDFGYDLEAWHAHILSQQELANDYTWHDSEEFCFADSIRAEFGNPRRVRFIEMLLLQDAAGGE